ncbi:FeoB small GTPase domain-containing protein [Bacteroides sp. AN502(2024)]|uniref:FeoB small GTPase domain-containing protein n=1 Tax=Bacteroides sp. AN502(2024) TaxID=3160599 RepID=UPI0035114C57
MGEDEPVGEIVDNSPITECAHLSLEEMQQLVSHKEKVITIAFAGNPNYGKTSIFNALSGAHEHIGNYSGVTFGIDSGGKGNKLEMGGTSVILYRIGLDLCLPCRCCWKSNSLCLNHWLKIATLKNLHCKRFAKKKP